MSRRLPALAAALLSAAGPAFADPPEVVGGEVPLTDVLISVPKPAGMPAGVDAVELPGGKVVPAQVTAAPLHADIGGEHLAFVLPSLPANETVRVAPAAGDLDPKPGTFAVDDRAADGVDVTFAGKPVVRYVNRPHDPADHYRTFKPFHHLFDPAGRGDRLTFGVTGSPKDGLFPHHRGLFFGFDEVRYGDRTADVWHGRDGEFQTHEELTLTEAGPVLARVRGTVGWHGKAGDKFATEEREVTVFRASDGYVVDWASRLTTDRPNVRLAGGPVGDPQHAGFQLRAAAEVADRTKKKTYYLRPDGTGEPGATRNWEPKSPDPRTLNVPWTAICFEAGGRRYTVLRAGHPGNPSPTRASERDYGRFGDDFTAELTPDAPLRLRYRVWVHDGEATVGRCAQIAAGFRSPPAVR